MIYEIYEIYYSYDSEWLEVVVWKDGWAAQPTDPPELTARPRWTLREGGNLLGLNPPPERIL